MLIRLIFSSVEEDILDLLVILAAFVVLRERSTDLYFCGLGNWRKELRCVVALGDIYGR